MKRYIFILAILSLCAASTYAQGIIGVKGDFAGRVQTNITHTNAGADTVNLTIPYSRNAITFKYDISKTSGTVAGTIVLQTKLTTVTGEQWATLDTYTLTDATATNLVKFTNNPGLYYRIITTITGTSVTVHNKFLLYRSLTL